MKYVLIVLVALFACEGKPRAAVPLNMDCDLVGNYFAVSLRRCSNAEVVCYVGDGLQCKWKESK